MILMYVIYVRILLTEYYHMAYIDIRQVKLIVQLILINKFQIIIMT